VAGLQIIQSKILGEDWSQYPESRRRMFYLIRKTNAPGVIFLSGDVHYAEIIRTDACAEKSHKHLSLTGDYRNKNQTANAPEWVSEGYYPDGMYPLYEYTSSSLTHSWGHMELPYRMSFKILDLVRPDEFIVRDEETDVPLFYTYNNFGLIEIDWDAVPSPVITLKAIGLVPHIRNWQDEVNIPDHEITHLIPGAHSALQDALPADSVESTKFLRSLWNLESILPSAQTKSLNLPDGFASAGIIFQKQINLSELAFTEGSTPIECPPTSFWPTPRRSKSIFIFLAILLVLILFLVLIITLTGWILSILWRGLCYCTKSKQRTPTKESKKKPKREGKKKQ